MGLFIGTLHYEREMSPKLNGPSYPMKSTNSHQNFLNTKQKKIEEMC